MKRFVVVPLVGIMLAALAVPALAEDNTNTLTVPTESAAVEVQGRYDPTTVATTVYSVDIKWGNMRAIYAPSRTKEWDPDNLTFNEVSGSADPWTWDRTVSSNGVEPNEIVITNNSSTSITCTFAFLHEETFPGITGVITTKENDAQSTFTIKSAANITSGSKEEKLSQVTQSGFLQLKGALDNDQETFQKIGTVSVTLSNE